jgi:hypothetical protein
VIGRLDPLARTAFGGLCLAALALEAVPVLLVVGVLGGVAIALGGNFDRALWVWLGSWAGSVVAGLLFLLFAYVFWPLASDWITEWQGYVAGFVIGGCGLAFMALFVFITDYPLALEVLVPLVVTFLVGFLFPGRLLGLGSHSALPQEQAKAAKRR